MIQRLTKQLILIILTLSLYSFSACSSKETFSNPDYAKDNDKSFFDVLKWKATSEPANWPDWIESKSKKVKYQRNNSEELSATFINHATVLVQINGINILTDPIWSQRASPVSFAGPKRVRGPGIAFDDLPPIDAVVLSHNHYDHFDVETLTRLYKRDNPKFYMGLENGTLLKDEGIEERVVEMDWDESRTLKIESGKQVEIIFKPAQHWSARWLHDRNQMLWGAFVIRSEKRSVYFAGDTGYSPHFSKTAEKYGPFDLSLIPIGAYEPRWFMRMAHLNPKEAVKAHKDLNTKKSMAIHFGTFQLSDEGLYEPHYDLKFALRKMGVDKSKFILPNFGEYHKIEN